MTGQDFRMIREFNLISKMDFCEKFGLKLTAVLDEIESNYEEVPSRFLLILTKMIGRNLLNNDVAKKEIRNIRSHIRKQNKIIAKNQLQKSTHGCIIR
jgi:hypothetical protein